MSTVHEATADKRVLEVAILQLIRDYQQKHEGLLVEGINMKVTRVNCQLPVQSIEATIIIN